MMGGCGQPVAAAERKSSRSVGPTGYQQTAGKICVGLLRSGFAKSASLNASLKCGQDLQMLE